MTAPIAHLRAARAVDPSQLPLEQLAGNPHVSQPAKLEEICRQFEAVLLREILRHAQKTVIASAFTDDSAAASIYRDLVTEQLASSISRSGAFGLAHSLTTELSRQVTPQTTTEDPALEP